MHRMALGIVLLWCLAAPTPALAFVPRAGDVVVVSEPIQDDVYISGGTVEAVASVDGDLAAVGGTVMLNGPVTGGVLAAGGTVTVGGTVGRNVRAAGGTVNVTGRIAADVVVAGGNLDVTRTAEIGRDLVAAGGEVRVSGVVKRKGFLSGGRIFISGTIQGDADVQANRLVLLPTAHIHGRLRYGADTMAEVQTGAQVDGGVERLPATAPRRSTAMFSRFPFRLAGGVLETLWLLVLGLVAVAIVPRRVTLVAEHIRTRFGFSLLIGFILFVMIPVAAVVLLFTVVAIPLSVAALLLYCATLYPAVVFTAVWIGEWVVRTLQRRPASSHYAAVVIGVLALAILFFVPWLGFVARWLAMLVGFGAFWVTVWDARNRTQAPVGGS